MKKALAALLALTMLLLLSACGAGAKTEQTAETPAAEAPAVTPNETPAADTLDFTAEAFDGSTVSLSDFADAKLIMVNFFEPWCGPCVGEMPGLEKLYQAYKDRGLVILGVFYSQNMDGDVQTVLDDTGVTYPILRGNEALLSQTSQYVPTTFFMDGQGHVVGEQIIGSMDYDSWESVVKELLGQ